jgi:hypothetical protein
MNFHLKNFLKYLHGWIVNTFQSVFKKSSSQLFTEGVVQYFRDEYGEGINKSIENGSLKIMNLSKKE